MTDWIKRVLNLHPFRAPRVKAAFWLIAMMVALSPGASAGRPVRHFKDCSECPSMVVVPGGGLFIGSPESEPGRHGNESPQRQLQIEGFAVSETEITRGQFRAFLHASHRNVEPGCDTQGDGADGNWDHVPSASWSNPGFSQTDDHPVVCVSWQDARDYAAWVAARTGRPYRLLTEAEWEYAARAGTASAFYWGDDEDAACRYANGGDRSLPRALPAWSIAIARAQREGEMGARLLNCDDGSGFTRPVGQLRANGFGLLDMSGNVWEWVEDCYQSGAYAHLSQNGRPPSAGNCERHRARGGSWDDYPIDLRTARRTSGLNLSSRRNDTGFRIARGLRQ